MTKKKISFIARTDFANVLTEWCEAINKNSKKFVAKSICSTPHKFDYPLKHSIDLLKSDKDSVNAIKEWILESSYIVFSEENPKSVPYDFDILDYNIGHQIKNSIAFKNNKLICFNGGSIYRDNFNLFNKKNGAFFKRLYSPDLYRLSPKGDHDIVIFPTKNIDLKKTELIERIYRKYHGNELYITHSPSTRALKGSKEIESAINFIIPKLNKNSKIKFEYLAMTNMSNKQILDAKNKSHIHIDQFNSAGGFGVSSIESMIFGNIILCSMHNTHDNISRKFGRTTKFPIIGFDYSDKESVKRELRRVLSMEKDDFIKKSIQTVNWYFKNASPDMVANAFEKRVFI